MSAKIEIRSGKPISVDTLQKIRAIFQESQCPNESMLASIEGFTAYDEAGHIQLAPGDTYKEYVETDE